MRITTDHAMSSYGYPVILDDAEYPMDYALGVRLLRTRLGLSTADLASLCGVSPRTVEGWEQGRVPNVVSLYAMRDLLRKKPRTKEKRR